MDRARQLGIGYAFPVSLDGVDANVGMTIREVMAMAAMQGLLASGLVELQRGSPEVIAIASLKCADALLDELAK